MRSPSRFLQLRFSEKILLFRVWCILIIVRSALALKPFKKVRDWLDDYSTPQKKLQNKIDPKRLAWLVDVAGRFVFRDKPCLTTALVLQMLLARRGHPTNIKIGIRKNEKGKIQAHAWLLHDEEIVIGNIPDLDEYKEMPDF